MKSHFRSTQFYGHDLASLAVESHASLLTTLLQNDGQSRIRWQQENHMQVEEAFAMTYHRKIERGVMEALGDVKKAEPYYTGTTTQGEIHTALRRSLAHSPMSDNLHCSPRTSRELSAHLNPKPAGSRQVGTLLNEVQWRTGTTGPNINHH